MNLPKKLLDLSPVQGSYCLVERSRVNDLYREAGYDLESEEIPNFLKIDGADCLFTENFVEKDGKEYEIVMLANGFSWEDILVYDEDEFEDQ